MDRSKRSHSLDIVYDYNNNEQQKIPNQCKIFRLYLINLSSVFIFSNNKQVSY